MSIKNKKLLMAGGIAFLSMSLGTFIASNRDYIIFADSINDSKTSSAGNVDQNNQTTQANTKVENDNKDSSEQQAIKLDNSDPQQKTSSQENKNNANNNNINTKNDSLESSKLATNTVQIPANDSSVSNEKIVDSSNNAADNSQTVHPVNGSYKDYENIHQDIQPRTQVNEPEKDTDNINGKWGTADWTYNNQHKIVDISGGEVDNSINAPWNSNTEIQNDVQQINFNDKLKLPADCGGLFANLPNLQSLNNSNNLDTSNVTNMRSMFANDRRLSTLDVSSWDTSNVKNMSYMFFSVDDLSNLNVGGNFGKNASNVNDMSYMFNGLISINHIDGLNQLNTKSVKNMEYMFNGDYNMQSIDLSNFNTSQVNNMDYMFGYNISLKKLDLGSFDTTNVNSMNGMLSNTLGVLVSDEQGNLYYMPGIQELKLGQLTKLSNNASLNEIVPKDVNNENNKYSGKWIINGNNNGNKYTSAELTSGKVPSGTYVWQNDLTNIKAKDTSIVAGPKSTWNFKDNFINATDMYGNPLDLNNLTTSGNADLSKVGTYSVIYSYKNAAGETIDQSANVNVINSKADIETKNTSLYVNNIWNPQSNLSSVKDMYGNPIDSSLVKHIGTVNTNKVGSYQVTYEYTDDVGNVFYKTATIKVIDNIEFNQPNTILETNPITYFKVMKINPTFSEKFNYYEVSYAPNAIDFQLKNGKILSAKEYTRVYQQKRVKKVKVVSKNGVYTYNNVNFNQSIRLNHIKYGSILKVKDIAHLNNDITRYILDNGQYITTNKSFVNVVES
ncbi:BspA family leucine-rich repeat surface protein [Apilactobacillus xinyiensis]|uniref:BspA family leucine-rich repeat surface protein n=1 Tax=Apilactobacillus xinyiensis TaxID=2841032 RepID=UPI001C7D63DE|nr:BspA family leucine-rich repeat surface protein [Apilactobacillus xinyiensis]